MRGGHHPAPSVGQVVRTVSMFEHHVGRRKSRAPYLVLGNGMLKRFNFVNAVSILSALARQRRAAPFSYLSAAFDSLQVKNNLVLFYRDNNTVVKIFWELEDWARHLQGRTIAENAFQSLEIPSLIESSTAPLPWIEESLVSSGPPAIGLVQANLWEVVSDIFRLHNCCRSRSLLHLSGSERTNFGRRAEMLKIEIPARVHRFLSAEQSRPAYKGFCHGDFSRGNMVGGGDSLVVIDWEKSGVDWVVRDLIKVFPEHPHLNREVFAAYASIASREGPDAVAPADLHLEAAIFLAKRFATGHPSKKYFENRGTPEAYQPELESVVHSITNHLVESSR